VALLSTGRQNGKSVVVRVIVGWIMTWATSCPRSHGWTTISSLLPMTPNRRALCTEACRDFEGVPRLRESTRITGFGDHPGPDTST
jgi:hypothetical protein